MTFYVCLFYSYTITDIPSQIIILFTPFDTLQNFFDIFYDPETVVFLNETDRKGFPTSFFSPVVARQWKLLSLIIIPYGNKFFTQCNAKNHMCDYRNKWNFNFLDIDYDDDDLECNLPLLEGAVLSATTSLNERGPENARLNGESNYEERLNTFFCCDFAILSRPKILWFF